MTKKILSLILCLALCLSMGATLTGCGGGSGKDVDAFVIMTEQLDGLFNPFFYTSSYDGTIVSMTQIGMLTSKVGADGKVGVAFGENEAVVTLDYESVENGDNTTSYYFVLKNGIKFADGEPLTMEDVLFNYYVYLDPVYTGSNTLYSTRIQGLKEYRTQTISSGNTNADDQISSQAATRAMSRKMELVNLYRAMAKSNDGEVDYTTMTGAISSHSLSSGYKSAVSNNPAEITNANLQADYDYALKLFKEELETDYLGAKDSYVDAPYDSHSEFKDEVFCFMYTEGYVQVEYAEGADGKKDRNTIEKLTKTYGDTIKTKEDAINFVYNDKIATALDEILLYWATGNTLSTEFTAKAKEVILHENAGSDGLAVPNISGIVSMGHTDAAGSKITVNGTEYTIASGHNADGTVTNANEYDVLKVTIDGVDPKAMWNFAITIAPQHYYGEGSKVGVDIANNQFGVEFASYDFMTGIIQSVRNIKLPMGAGSYKCTNSKNSDKPSETDFYTNNVVYFKSNQNFQTVGAGIENAKIDKIRYQVVSSNNAISALQDGSVHYISPQLTTNNYEQRQKLGKKGIKMLESPQLGYGYIGINSAKINDINLRRAIMCAMNTAQALSYYRAGTAQQICWNMSTVSWAYPDGQDENYNGHDYPQMGSWSYDTAVTNVKKYMEAAGVSAGDSQLKVTFTIAGSSLQDHPTYKVFRDAAEMLNSLGWEVDVVCDSLALTKINTGSLAVWAAAWSSALDPDMYQVYHKDSTATSTLAWGYNYLKSSGSAEEMSILNNLSDLIDKARETNDQTVRADLYKDAMGYILDLAVELPVYQRNVLYAYNSKVIASSSLPSELNPYSSPLDRIWEIEFAK